MLVTLFVALVLTWAASPTLAIIKTNIPGLSYYFVPFWYGISVSHYTFSASIFLIINSTCFLFSCLY